jgi:transcriptional regulator with XRE-family HTH domain|tara:strand:- start:259 stop:645 length:387 start_codon:yes stop_codon:yes gene_type:complete
MSGDKIGRERDMKRKYNSMMSGEELKSARKSLGLTLQQMADQLGVGMRMYCYYEKGEKPIPLAIEQSVKANLGAKEPLDGFSMFDLNRIKALRKEIDDILGIGSVDIDRLEKILKQSSKEFDNMLSKY